MDVITRKAIHHVAWLLYRDSQMTSKLENGWDLGAVKANEDAACFLNAYGFGETDGLWAFTPNEKLLEIMNDEGLSDD